ncbi:MAG: DUF47 family protein [Victivallales bacterium]|nr:DUF47 family protein [Victivallales bacterium]
MFFNNKNHEIKTKLEDFFSLCESVLKELHTALEYVCAKGIDSHFETIVEKISEMEKDADNLRRAIEYKMISKSLLPETREELLEIIHLLDNIPDHCERVVYIFQDQLSLPHESIKDDLIELTKVGMKCFDCTLKIAKDYLNKKENIKKLSLEADEMEHIGDKLERKMIQNIFRKKLGTGKKIIQKQIIVEVGDICDISKQASMRIFTSSIKRKI